MRSYIGCLEQRVEDLSRVRKRVRRERVLVLDAAGIGRPCLTEARHVDIVAASIRSPSRVWETRTRRCTVRGWGGNWGSRSRPCRVVCTDVRGGRVGQRVIEQGDDLIVQVLRLLGVLRQATQERESLRELWDTMSMNFSRPDAA